MQSLREADIGVIPKNLNEKIFSNQALALDKKKCNSILNNFQTVRPSQIDTNYSQRKQVLKKVSKISELESPAHSLNKSLLNKEK